MRGNSQTGKRLHRLFFWLSALLFLAFFGSFARFVWDIAATSPSFAEAFKHLLLFSASVLPSLVLLAFGIVFAGVAIKLADDIRKRKTARNLFVWEMIVFTLALLVIVSMAVVV